MSVPVVDFSHAVFAKTSLGHQEVQARTLKLGPAPRRLLILIDGKRSTQELASFVAGSNVTELLTELLNKGCIESTTALVFPAPEPSSGPSLDEKTFSTDTQADDYLSRLPDVSTRSAKDAEMARNFMMNTVNGVFQPNTRLTLLEAIFSCKTPQDMRDIYPKWAETINSNANGRESMAEFQKKLAQVL